MIEHLRSPLFACALGLLATAAASAADEHAGRPQSDQPGHAEPGRQQPNGPGVLSLLPANSTTEHSIDLASGKLNYTATAGTFSLFDQSGERSAAIFYAAFVLKPNDPRRPLTFVFNGGPGAGSAFLNLGLAGPRIAVFGDGYDGAKVHLADNPDTWLAFTDLVFVDPVGTGWSRAAKPDGGNAFWDVHRDAESMAKVIALYIANNGRVSSPKFMLGESYGGFRAAKVARALQNNQGIIASGIVMLSPMLEGWLTFGDDESALRAALQLPSLAAATLERKHAFTPAALAAAEKFAMTDYLTTMAGAPPQGEAGKAFYERVAQLSGLPLDVVTQARGFVEGAYVKNLRPDGKIVSRYDATFAVDDPYPELRSAHGPDPILDSISRAYGGAFAAYARNELGFKTEMTYALLSGQVTGGWDWQGGRLQASAEDDLRTLLAFSPTFRLLVAHGYSDMITPYGMTRYALDHLPADTASRAQLKLYRGGHMLYLDAQSRKAFSADAAVFIRGGE